MTPLRLLLACSSALMTVLNLYLLRREQREQAEELRPCRAWVLAGRVGRVGGQKARVSS